MDPDASIPTEPEPSVFSYVLSFLLVGVAWGFTTPFIRRAAADFNARQEKQANASAERGRSRSPKPSQPRFTDDGEEQELLSPVGRDNEAEHGGDVRDRSTSRSDLNRKPKTGKPNTDFEIGNGTSSRSPNSLSEDEEDNLPAPAWRRGPAAQQSWLRTKVTSIFWTVINLLRTPAYAIPLVINLTGSIWFFLLVGKHELSLTVPLINSSAFLFTVFGEWYVERKVIAKQTWLGMGLVLGGIAVCVHSKNQVS